MTIEIRRAVPSEAESLSELAMRSKAHWGYDAAFMAACREELTLTPLQLAENHFLVAELNGHLVAFGGIAIEGPLGTIEDVFVEPDQMGKGVGRAVMVALLDKARSFGLTRLRVDADPNAKGFYESFGFCQVGQVPSGSITGRLLPHLQLDLH